jgi:hypothetical protein
MDSEERKCSECELRDRAIKWLMSKEAEAELVKLKNLHALVEKSLRVSQECMERRVTI